MATLPMVVLARFAVLASLVTPTVPCGDPETALRGHVVVSDPSAPAGLDSAESFADLDPDDDDAVAASYRRNCGPGPATAVRAVAPVLHPFVVTCRLFRPPRRPSV